MTIARHDLSMVESLIWSATGITVGAVLGVVALKAHERELHSNSDRTAAADILGWQYDRLDAGFTVSGRHVGRPWELIVSEIDAARWTTFTLGAPDIDRALCLILQSSVNHAIPQGLSPVSTGQPKFLKHHQIYSADPEHAARIVDDEVQQLLLRWPGNWPWLSQKLNHLCVWVCPHGIRVSVNRPLQQWAQIQHLVLIGQTLALRNGLV
jgi:hypothetical protein